MRVTFCDSRSDREVSRDKITQNNTKEIRLRAYSRSPGRSCRPFSLANANSAWRSIAPFPHSIESILGRLRRADDFCRIATQKPFVFCRRNSPRENAAAPADTAARSGLFVFSPASVSSPFFSPWNNLTFFLCRTRTRGRSIFSRVY